MVTPIQLEKLFGQEHTVQLVGLWIARVLNLNL